MWVKESHGLKVSRFNRVNLASFYRDEFTRMLNGETDVNLDVADRRSLKKAGLIKPVANNRIHGFIVTWDADIEFLTSR